MIPFFRIIRKKLADDNPPASRAGQFLKYSRYAIGEIVLVVVGILIALSINNWNEERKQLLNEIALNKKIIADLKDESISLKNQISWAKNHQDSHYAIYNRVKEKFNDESYINYNNLHYYFPYRLKIKDIYQENLNEITNENVRDMMREYINIENQTNFSLETFNSYKKENVHTFLERNGIYNTDSVFNIEPYIFRPEKEVLLINITKLEKQFSSVEFNSILFKLRMMMSYMIYKFQDLDEFNQKFILELEDEIKKE